MATAAVRWVGVGSNAGKVLTADTLSSAWIGVSSMSANTTNFVEGTQSLSEKVSNTTAQGYTVNTTDVIGEPFDFSSSGGNFGDHIYAWISAYESWDTLENGGFGIVVADDLATDSYATWYVGPQPGFLGGWASYVIHPSKRFDLVIQAGTGSWTTTGNPAQLSGVDGFGARWKITRSITGNVDNCFVDSMSVGTGYEISQGDAGSAKATFDDVISFEENTTSGRFGGIRGVSGIAFSRSKIYIGAASGSTNTEFSHNGFTVVWEKAVLAGQTLSAVSDTLYELKTRKGSGTTYVNLANGSLSAVSPHEVYLDFTGATGITLSNVNVDRARLIDIDNAVKWDGGQITNSGQFTITSGTPTLTNVSFINSTDPYAMSISNANRLSNVSNITFNGAGVGGSGSCGLRLNLGAVGGVGVTLTNVFFQNRVSGSHDILIPADVTGTINITVSGGSTPTVNDLRDPDDYNIITGSVDVTVTVKDTQTPPQPIINARVLLTADTGGPYPYDVTVTIVNSGTTATVTHAAHGLVTGDKVLINGASHWQNNGVFTITVTGAGTYTYIMPSDPGSSPTGTIKATFVALHGLSDSSGVVTANRSYSGSQPIVGRVRKSSSSPYYKSQNITGSVNSSSGFSATVQLISDE